MASSVIANAMSVPCAAASSPFGAFEIVKMPYISRPSSSCRVFASGSDNSVKVQQQSQAQRQPVKSNGNSSSIQQQQQQRMMNTPRRQSQSPLSPLDLWDPFMPASRSFGQMMDLMSQVIDGGVVPSASSSAAGASAPQIQRRSFGRLPWDVMEDEECFMMRVDMPGLTKDEVKVSVVDDGFLVIKGETSSERKESDKWAARSLGSYESRVMIPDNVEVGKIKAELKDGVLYVTVPKKKVEAKKPVEIQVS